MVKKLVLPKKSKYTFADYFKLNAETADVMRLFDYAFRSQPCRLPETKFDPRKTAALRQRIEMGIKFVSLTSEVARREFLIAPVLWEVAAATRARISVEYPVEVDQRLSGTLDYFLRKERSLLVVEAKNADMEKGFTQLGVGLIALEKWLERPEPILYGAISVGNIWQFGLLNRREKLITRDLNLYRVTEDLDRLLNVLAAILDGKTSKSEMKG